MARIRPAKSGGSGDQGGAGAPLARRRPTAADARERRAQRPRPAPQARAEKAGTVTKAVQAGRASRFLGEVATELRKVSWPTRPQLFQATGVVLVFVAIVTVYLAVLDELFGRLVDAIF
jgi:preprotein translocase subunit SecE